MLMMNDNFEKEKYKRHVHLLCCHKSEAKLPEQQQVSSSNCSHSGEHEQKYATLGGEKLIYWLPDMPIQNLCPDSAKLLIGSSKLRETPKKVTNIYEY